MAGRPGAVWKPAGAMRRRLSRHPFPCRRPERSRLGNRFFFTPPPGLRGGCYTLHLTCAVGEDWVPFYLLAPRQGRHAPIAFLASTLTYIAHANHTRGNVDAAFRARMAEWGACPYNANDFPIYGRSTYNRHDDGTGISLSSRLRPILTMRPGYITFDDVKGSGLRHFVADTHLLAWLEDKGFECPSSAAHRIPQYTHRGM